MKRPIDFKDQFGGPEVVILSGIHYNILNLLSILTTKLSIYVSIKFARNKQPTRINGLKMPAQMVVV